MKNEKLIKACQGLLDKTKELIKACKEKDIKYEQVNDVYIEWRNFPSFSEDDIKKLSKNEGDLFDEAFELINGIKHIFNNIKITRMWNSTKQNYEMHIPYFIKNDIVKLEKALNKLKAEDEKLADSPSSKDYCFEAPSTDLLTRADKTLYELSVSERQSLSNYYRCMAVGLAAIGLKMSLEAEYFRQKHMELEEIILRIRIL